MTDTTESLERRLKAMDDEDGVSRYITDDDDIWYISGDMLAALKEKDADNERLRTAIQRFMRMVEGDTAPTIVESCMNQARQALEGEDD